MKRKISEFTREPIITLMPDVAFSQVSFWFNATLRQLKMDILLPKHRDIAGPQPLIVWVCGGAFQQVDRHVWLGEMLWYAKHGFTVASVEYRTSMDAVWPAQIVDVKSAIRFLRAHAEELCVDPRRIAIMGESAGGYLAVMAGVTGNVREFDQGEHLDQSSAVQAVVDYYGVSQMKSIAHSDGRSGDVVVIHGDPIALLMGGSQDTIPEAYLKASPITWVDEKCPPFLILHGDCDPLVDISQSELLYEALKKAGVPVEFDIYTGVTHGADEFYQANAKQRVADFLLSYI